MLVSAVCVNDFIVQAQIGLGLKQKGCYVKVLIHFVYRMHQ